MLLGRSEGDYRGFVWYVLFDYMSVDERVKGHALQVDVERLVVYWLVHLADRLMMVLQMPLSGSRC